jgi:formylglycine-generating enzyme required for sulfatase activity/calcineurin-like phosphoesterase family protein
VIELGDQDGERQRPGITIQTRGGTRQLLVSTHLPILPILQIIDGVPTRGRARWWMEIPLPEVTFLNLVSSHRDSRWLVLAVTVCLGVTIWQSPKAAGNAQTQDQRRLEQTAGEAAKQLGGYYALVIGNNDYRYIRKLQTAVNDAQVVEKALRETFGFKTRLLLNADRDQILAALIDYRRTLDENANLLIYYAGHGHYDRDVDKAYWIPVDAQSDSNLKWISADDITTDIKGTPARHVLIISDSCYSGMMTREANVGLAPKERERYIEKMRSGKSRILMASGGDEPVTDSGGSGHSVFAAALLDGFRQIGEDVFTSSELFYQYVSERVAGNSDQAPEYSPIRNSGHQSGDFVFVRRTRAEVAKPVSAPAKVPASAKGLFSKIKEKIGTGPDGVLLRSYQFETPKLDSRGVVIDRHGAEAHYFLQDLGDGVTLEMVKVPGGMLIMGSPASEANRDDDEGPQHEVSVPGFYAGKFEVTQAQWRAVAALPKVNGDLDPAPSHFKGDELPAETVSWEDAIEFCARLSRKTGLSYRLPSEAEWEYACRAGTTTPFAFGETIAPDLVNYSGDFPYGSASKGANRQMTVPVGSLREGVNGFGLYDMHGNVWEWCMDVWHSDYAGAPSDGSAWVTGGDPSFRVLRGGSWNDLAFFPRSAYRLRIRPTTRADIFGFRVVVAERT